MNQVDLLYTWLTGWGSLYMGAHCMYMNKCACIWVCVCMIVGVHSIMCMLINVWLSVCMYMLHNQLLGAQTW